MKIKKIKECKKLLPLYLKPSSRSSRIWKFDIVSELVKHTNLLYDCYRLINTIVLTALDMSKPEIISGCFGSPKDLLSKSKGPSIELPLVKITNSIEIINGIVEV